MRVKPWQYRCKAIALKGAPTIQQGGSQWTHMHKEADADGGVNVQDLLQLLADADLRGAAGPGHPTLQ